MGSLLKNLASGEIIPLESGRVILGRTRGDVLVNDPKVSGEHAELSLRGESWLITDLGSTHGTFIGQDTAVKGSCLLRSGDVFRIGNTQFQLDIQGIPPITNMKDFIKLMGSLGKDPKGFLLGPSPTENVRLSLAILGVATIVNLALLMAFHWETFLGLAPIFLLGIAVERFLVPFIIYMVGKKQNISIERIFAVRSKLTPLWLLIALWPIFPFFAGSIAIVWLVAYHLGVMWELQIAQGPLKFILAFWLATAGLTVLYLENARHVEQVMRSKAMEDKALEDARKNLLEHSIDQQQENEPHEGN